MLEKTHLSSMHLRACALVECARARFELCEEKQRIQLAEFVRGSGMSGHTTTYFIKFNFKNHKSRLYNMCT